MIISMLIWKNLGGKVNHYKNEKMIFDSIVY